MFNFKILVLMLAAACFIEVGVAHPSQIRSKRDQYQRSEMPKEGGIENKMKMERIQDQDVATVVTPEEDVDDSNNKRVGSKSGVDVVPRSYAGNVGYIEVDPPVKQNKGPFPTNTRMLYPYVSSKNLGRHFRSRNAWKPKGYIQQPYYIPVYGLESDAPLYLPQQSVFPSETSRDSTRPPPTVVFPDTAQETTEQTSSPFVPQEFLLLQAKKKRFTHNFIDDKPVWDIEDAAYVSTASPSKILSKDVEGGKYNNYSPFVVEEETSITSELTSKIPDTPSNCVLAIVSCCSVSSEDVNMNCFKQFTCYGPFWDNNPCGKEFVKYAVDRAVDFYKSS